MRLIDADALPIVSRGKNHHRKYVFADITEAPTIDAIPVEWLRQMAEENSHYAEPYFAFAYVLHEWQQTKSIEELQAESEMRDWKAEQELDI